LIIFAHWLVERLRAEVFPSFARRLKEVEVGGGKVVADDVAGFDPHRGLDGEELGDAALVLAEERVEADAGVGVVVLDRGEGGAGGDDDAEFFSNFAHRTLGEGFAGVALTAGEFPEAAEDGVVHALADEDFFHALIEDDGDGDDDALAFDFVFHGGSDGGLAVD
jgi:hypothetical protein